MVVKDAFKLMLLYNLIQSFRTSEVVFAQNRENILKNPNVYYTTTELICSEGYPAQEHVVITKDGYVLTIHRIPNSNRRQKVFARRDHYRKIHLNHHPDFDSCIMESLNETATGMPVVIVHGLVMASDNWLLQGPKYDLAYIMADHGYDVWLANVRGNFYSRKHLSMSPSDPKFWDFSFHEHSIYDLPATIDYILALTERQKIGYVGMSMGTTIFFTMTSLLPEYNDKILASVMLAPVAYLKYTNTTPRKKVVLDLFIRLTAELRKRNVSEVFAKTSVASEFGKIYCSKGSRFQDICYDFVSFVCGTHSKLVPRDKFHLYMSHLPAGTSLKTVFHYHQNIKGSQFKFFDYGLDKNLVVYGAPEPPAYPIWKVTAPVALYYSTGDTFCNVKDMEVMRKLLRNVVDVDESHEFNHADFVWSYTAKDGLYPRALKVFEKFSNQLKLTSPNDISKEP